MAETEIIEKLLARFNLSLDDLRHFDASLARRTHRTSKLRPSTASREEKVRWVGSESLNRRTRPCNAKPVARTSSFRKKSAPLPRPLQLNGTHIGTERRGKGIRKSQLSLQRERSTRPPARRTSEPIVVQVEVKACTVHEVSRKETRKLNPRPRSAVSHRRAQATEEIRPKAKTRPTSAISSKRRDFESAILPCFRDVAELEPQVSDELLDGGGVRVTLVKPQVAAKKTRPYSAVRPSRNNNISAQEDTFIKKSRPHTAGRYKKPIRSQSSLETTSISSNWAAEDICSW